MGKKKRMTNKEYSMKNKEFDDLCQKFDCKNTPRQASKFRNKKGVVYKKSKGLM